MDPAPLPRDHPVDVVVKSTSKLKKLVLCGPIETPLLTAIGLTVEKPGVELQCWYVTLKYLAVASANRGNRNPRRFVELDWYAV